MRVNFGHRAIGLRYAARLVDGPHVTVLAHMRGAFSAAEKAAESGNIEDALAPLRALSLDEFGRVMVGKLDVAVKVCGPALVAVAETVPELLATVTEVGEK